MTCFMYGTVNWSSMAHACFIVSQSLADPMITATCGVLAVICFLTREGVVCTPLLYATRRAQTGTHGGPSQILALPSGEGERHFAEHVAGDHASEGGTRVGRGVDGVDRRMQVGVFHEAQQACEVFT